MSATKKILVTLSTFEIEVPEEATDDEISETLDELFHPDAAAPVKWDSWKHADEWRN